MPPKVRKTLAPPWVQISNHPPFVGHLARKVALMELYVYRSTCKRKKCPCEKNDLKNQWFKPVASENKSLVRKKLITGFKKLTSGFWDLAKIS